MDWEVEYYKKQNGDMPVVNYLLTLDAKTRAKAFSETELLQKHGPNLKEPYVARIHGPRYRGLFELRIRFSSNTSRIFYFVHRQRTFVLLCGLTKKSNKTPKDELERALRYRDDFERRCQSE